MNRCIQCVNFKIAVIRHGGRYKGCQDGFCAYYKKPIGRDDCCEMWQERKIDGEIYEKKHISVQDSPSIFIIDFDKI